MARHVSLAEIGNTIILIVIEATTSVYLIVGRTAHTVSSVGESDSTVIAITQIVSCIQLKSLHTFDTLISIGLIVCEIVSLLASVNHIVAIHAYII